MTVRCLALYSGRVDEHNDVANVKEFPYGSEYLRAPHWHLRFHSGFRTNLPKSLYSVAVVR